MTTNRFSAWLPGFRSAAVVLCIGMAAVAQSYLGRPQMLTEGKVLFVIVLIVAWWTLGRAGGSQTWTTSGTAPRSLPLRRMAPFLILAIVTDVIAAVYAMRESRARDGFYLWLIAFALALATIVAYQVAPLLRAPRAMAIPWKISRRRVFEMAALAGIIALALYLRLVDIGQVPVIINLDEGNDGFQALGLVDGSTQNVFTMGMGSMPRLSMLPAAIVMSVWKADLEGLRTSMALVGVLGLPFLYILARMFVSVPFSLLATFLLAAAPANIYYSRYGVPNVEAAVLTVAFVLFLLRAVRRMSSSDALCCGVVGGLAVYSYHSNRVFAIITIAVILFAMAGDLRRWLSYVRLALIILAVVLFVAAPQLGYYASNPRTIFGHTAAHVWLTDPAVRASTNPTDALPILATRMADRAFWGFNTYSDTSEHFARGKLLDPVTAVLYLFGLAVCLRRLRDVRYFALVATFVIFVIFLGALILVPPDASRMTGLLPIQCLMAGIALQSIWGVVKQSGTQARAVAGVVLFAVGPALLLAMNYNYFFNIYSPARAYDDVRSNVVRYVQAHDVTPFVLRGDFTPNDVQFRFAAPGKSGYAMTAWEDYVPVRQSLTREAAFIATESAAPALGIIQAYYPNGVLDEERTPAGRLVFASYRVSARDIAAYQGLAGQYTSAEGGSAPVSRADALVSFDWTRDRPEGIDGAFAATWDGSLFVPEFGSWRMQVQGTGTAKMFLDGALVLSKAQDSEGTAPARLTLAKGWHALHLDYRTDGGSLRLLWGLADKQPELIGKEYLGIAATVTGLRASYYAGPQIAGDPVIEAIEPAFFNRGNAYTTRYGGKPCAATWSGAITTDTAGTYRFAALAFSGVFALNIDGRAVVAFGEGVGDRREGTIDLERGRHTIEMSFISPRGQTDSLQLWWAPPGSADLVLVPPVVLTPASK